MAVSASSAIEQVREERRALVVAQITASGITDAEALEVASSLIPQLSNRGAGQLSALQTLLPILQASPTVCSSLLARLLPPLTTLASRPGAPSALLSATFPCINLLVSNSSSQTESGRQVASAVPSLLSTLMQSIREGSTCRPPALGLLISIMSHYPGSCGQAASKIETTLVSTLGQGVGMKLLGKVFSLLPQLGGGGKEGVEHSAAHQRLLLSTISTLHNSLDTLLEHKVKEFPCARPTSTSLALPPCNGSGLERAALLSRQLQDLASILGSLLTRGFPTSRSIPVDLIISLSSRLLSLPSNIEDQLALILPRLTTSFVNLLRDLIDSCDDLLLPEAASINSLIVSGLTRKDKLSSTVRRALHDLVTCWCQNVGAACGLDLCAPQILPPLLKEILPRKREVVLDQGTKKKGKRGKVSTLPLSTQPSSSSQQTTELQSSALAAVEAIFTAVGPWLDAKTHQLVSSAILSLSLSPLSSIAISPSLLASLCSSPHQCTAPLVLPALQQSSLALPTLRNEAKAGVASLLTILHPHCASLDLKAAPMVTTDQVVNGTVSLDEDEDVAEEARNELSDQLTEAQRKISALEQKLKSQEALLKEAQDDVEKSNRLVYDKNLAAPTSDNVKLDSPSLGLKRPVEAAEEETNDNSVKKLRENVENINNFPNSVKESTDRGPSPSSSGKLLGNSTDAHNAHSITMTSSKLKPSKNDAPPPPAPKPQPSTATATPSVSVGDKGAAGPQLSVEEMLADFKDKLSDNLLRMGNPSYVNAAIQDSDSD